MQAFFPLFMDLSQIKVVVIGGGKIAQRRIEALQQFEAQVRVIAPQITDSLQKLIEAGRMEWLARSYQPGDLADPQIGIAIVATDQRSVNQRAGEEAKSRGIPVSVADCKEESTFYFPGIAKKGGLVIGVTASGQDHKRAAVVTRKLRSFLEELKDEE
ncbi:MAG: bifunctional precorrin-2 dehydrogenase/sirohydrochlorin ferrochelatase [Lachnospiraceae bacterium]|jgi:siroheme synthase-like protein|nr:bifunctional precorrin-2 dehydrogenase/sirohydrochlorin ferrochelatase [Lachnospiraceae bacterium]